MYGIDVDLAAEFSKRLNCTVLLMEIPWLALFPAPEAGELGAVVSGISIAAERQQRFAFTHSYMSMGQMAIIRRDDSITHYRVPFEFASVGYEAGTAGESSVRWSYRGQIVLKAYPVQRRGRKHYGRGRLISLFTTFRRVGGYREEGSFSI